VINIERFKKNFLFHYDMNLSREKQEYIDSVVDRFREQYGVQPDWQRLADDKSIKYVADNRFVVPISGELKAGVFFIGVQENSGTPYGEWSRTHELGHILLGHVNSALPIAVYEEEANYFAQKVIGKEFDLASFFSQTIFDFLRHPVVSLEAAFGPRRFYEYHVEKVLGLRL